MDERGYPQKISKKPGYTHIGTRHAEKDTGALETKENQQQLSPAGRESAREDAQEFFRWLIRAVPAGGIVSLSSSTMDRAQETKRIFVDTLLELIQENKDHAATVIVIHCYGADGTPRSNEEIRRATRATRARYLIIDEQPDADFGYRRDEVDNLTIFNGAMEFFKSEHVVSMLWAARPDEFPELIHRLYGEVKKQRIELTAEEEEKLLNDVIAAAKSYLMHSQRTPEALVAHQLEAVERSVARSFAVRPERRHISLVIQHAPGLSFLVLALFERDGISFKSYDALGDYQHYLEAMSFDVDLDGNVIFVDFRKNRSSIEPVKLKDIIVGLYQKSEARKQAWDNFFNHSMAEAT